MGIITYFVDLTLTQQILYLFVVEWVYNSIIGAVWVVQLISPSFLALLGLIFPLYFVGLILYFVYFVLWVLLVQYYYQYDYYY